MKPYQQILNKYYHRGYFTDAEIADLLECSRKRISEIRKGNSDLWADELLILQSYFAECGRKDLANLSFPEDHRMYQLKEMELNGTWKDETRVGISHIVHADEAASENRFEDSLDYVGKARRQLDQFEAEVKNAKG